MKMDTLLDAKVRGSLPDGVGWFNDKLDIVFGIGIQFHSRHVFKALTILFMKNWYVILCLANGDEEFETGSCLVV